MANTHQIINDIERWIRPQIMCIELLNVIN